MKLHRFFVKDHELGHDFWLHDEKLLHQWNDVLRFKSGQQVVLLDGTQHDKLYKIDEIKQDEVHLLHITDLERRVPKRNVYVLWSLLEKDRNDQILQKCTELGVSHFLPLITDRSEKADFNHERAEKIVIEAARQSGRSDIPSVREPMHVTTAIEQLGEKVELYICEQDGEKSVGKKMEAVGLLIAPEGGWSDAEKALFKEKNIKHLHLHDFTLPIETTAPKAAGKLLQ